MKTKKSRSKPRKELRISVQVEHQSMLQKFYSRNLSSGGIFLEISGDPPPIGSRMKLRFQVPTLERDIRADAEVIHHHSYEDMDQSFKKVEKHGIGLKFIDLSKKDETQIHEYVSGKDLRIAT